MTETTEAESGLAFPGPILGFDVDWARGRVALVVDGSDNIEQAVIVDKQLQRSHGFGALGVPPDGRSATSVALHPREAIVVTTGWDRPIRVWDAEPTARMQRELGQAAPLSRARTGYWGAVWSSCGNFLDTHNLGRERGERFDWRSGELVAVRWGHAGPMVRHPGGDLLALAIGADASSMYFAQWHGPTVNWLPVAIDLFVPCRVAFGAGTMAIVGGTSQIHAAVFDFPDLTQRFGRKLQFVDEEIAAEFGVSQALALAPDGSTLYVPGPDGEIAALAADTGIVRERWRAHSGMVTQMAHHPTDGVMLSSALDGTLRLSRVPQPGALWDAESELIKFVAKHKPGLLDPDGLPRGAMKMIDTHW